MSNRDSDPSESGRPPLLPPAADISGLGQYFTALMEGIPHLVWTSHDAGRWTWASQRWLAYTGQTDEASKGAGWQMAVHPDDQAMTVAAWHEADVSGVLDVEHRLLNPNGSGEARWFHTHATPLPEVQGREREWLGICTDVHETRLLEERQHRLQDALQHRIGDILALTRAVARRTAKVSGSVEEYALHLDSRLDVIARTQAMLRAPQAGVELEHLVRDGLLAYAAHEGEQVHVSGPSFILRSGIAELFGLAMHELAMNAVKHGALSLLHGCIDVTWRVEKAGSGDLLRFEWVETGVPMPDGPPQRQGFGTELIENVLKLELGAMASLGFERDGVRCTILLPFTTDTPRPDLPSRA